VSKPADIQTYVPEALPSITRFAFELSSGTAFEVTAAVGKLESDLSLENELIPDIRLFRAPVPGKQRMKFAVKGEIEAMVVAAAGREPTIHRLQERIAELEEALRYAHARLDDCEHTPPHRVTE